MNTTNLMDRIVGALTFRSGVYDDVEADTSFTQTAWIMVIVIGFLNQLGANGNVVGAAIGTIFVVIGFYIFTWIVAWVGANVFKASVTHSELVRTLGLAYVWNIIGLLAIVGGGLAGLIVGIAGLLGLIASFVAAKAALDLDWLQTIVTVVIGFIAFVIVLVIAGVVIAALGFAAASVIQ